MHGMESPKLLFHPIYEAQEDKYQHIYRNAMEYVLCMQDKNFLQGDYGKVEGKSEGNMKTKTKDNFEGKAEGKVEGKSEGNVKGKLKPHRQAKRMAKLKETWKANLKGM